MTKEKLSMEYIFRSGIYGLTVGDALGVPVEFFTREQLSINPVIDMIGHGTYNLKAGTWSDDTSLSLATLDGMIGGVNYKKIAQNFSDYFNKDAFCQRYMFDIGDTTSEAIREIDIALNLDIFDEKAIYGGLDENNNGNGSLMRMIPVVLYLYDHIDEYNTSDKRQRFIYKLSALTHATPLCMFGCRLYVEYALMLLYGIDKETAFKTLVKQFEIYIKVQDMLIDYKKLLNKRFPKTKESKIQSDGYVVNSLKAAIWCFLNTDNYKDCVLKAVNLGIDTDTTACIAGGLAGISYGYDSIPKEWLDEIYKKEIIDDIILRYFSAKNS